LNLLLTCGTHKIILPLSDAKVKHERKDTTMTPFMTLCLVVMVAGWLANQIIDACTDKV
jgi:hypothetical protein